jgi:hypothetical protein
MTVQGRELQVIDFFEQCCSNATRGTPLNGRLGQKR